MSYLSEENTKEILDYLVKKHEEHADGCKGSCWEYEIGYKYYAPKVSYPDENYFYVRFGGYCLGTLDRHMEVKTAKAKDLFNEVKRIVEVAISNLD